MLEKRGETVVLRKLTHPKPPSPIRNSGQMVLWQDEREITQRSTPDGKNSIQISPGREDTEPGPVNPWSALFDGKLTEETSG